MVGATAETAVVAVECAAALTVPSRVMPPYNPEAVRLSPGQ